MVTSERRLPAALRVAVGGSALSAAFVAGVAVAGGFAGPAGPQPFVPAADKDALIAFDDCTQLLDRYVDGNLDDVGPYGWGQPPYPVTDDWPGAVGAVPEQVAPAPARGSLAAGESGTASDGSAPEAVTNSATGTNVQEAGVDEPDTAKTDGRLLVRLVDDAVELLDVSGPRAEPLSSHRLPGGLHATGLLLVDDHVLVVTETPIALPASPTDTWREHRIAPALRASKLLDLDVSDPREPRLVGEKTFTGDVQLVRQYGDVVRVVTSTPRPDLDWVRPGGSVSEDEATERNRELVGRSTIDDWLPAVTDADGESRTVPCGSVFRAGGGDGGATLAVFGFDVDRPDELASVAVQTDSRVVYSSADRIYVATTRSARGFWRSAYGRLTGEPVLPRPDKLRTRLHSFALDGIDTSYVASGHVDGTVRDRWSLDEQDGRLRVALALPGGWSGTVENAVAVLAEEGGRLVQKGYVDGLGPDEEIKAVRWFDDFAVVVTFRQTDPLYTVDFSDPEDPRAAGELKIPGYSGYLHPIGDGLLLGLGVDGTESGTVLGAQVALFDVRDLASPRRLDTARLGDGFDVPAMQDPRAFTWLPAGPGSGTGITAARFGASTKPALTEVHDGRLDVTALGGPDVTESLRTLPLDGDRVALVDKDVTVLALR
jgi:hypothetical protein